MEASEAFYVLERAPTRSPVLKHVRECFAVFLVGRRPFAEFLSHEVAWVE